MSKYLTTEFHVRCHYSKESTCKFITHGGWCGRWQVQGAANFTMSIDFGDGRRELLHSNITSSPRGIDRRIQGNEYVFNISHAYATSGVFAIHANLSNAVSWLPVDEVALVVKRLSGVVVSTDSELVEAGSLVWFNATVQTDGDGSVFGSQLFYRWSFGDHQTQPFK